jgi:hypothetical protein
MQATQAPPPSSPRHAAQRGRRNKRTPTIHQACICAKGQSGQGMDLYIHAAVRPRSRRCPSQVAAVVTLWSPTALWFGNHFLDDGKKTREYNLDVMRKRCFFPCLRHERAFTVLRTRSVLCEMEMPCISRHPLLWLRQIGLQSERQQKLGKRLISRNQVGQQWQRMQQSKTMVLVHALE